MTTMASRRFLNPAQPQTLVIAVYLLYLNAAFLLFALLQQGVFRWYYLLSVVAGMIGGFGIANEKKWGYGVGIAAAIAPFAIRMYETGNPFDLPLLSLMFAIALVALLLHPQSRDYQRLWFK